LKRLKSCESVKILVPSLQQHCQAPRRA
jgi:hypothetical protein